MEPARRRRVEDALATAYVPMQRYLLRRTDRTTAEDVLGDALLVLWRRADDIPDEALLPWCYAVARRCLANHVRGEARRERLRRRLALVPEPVASDDLDLSAALDALGPTDREVLRLWAWEQLLPREIAVVLAISPNAASIRLHRALGRLRSQLAGKEAPVAGHLPGDGRRGRETAR